MIQLIRPLESQAQAVGGICTRGTYDKGAGIRKDTRASIFFLIFENDCTYMETSSQIPQHI